MIDRFASKVALAETGCLEWQASTNGVGYGKFYLGRVDGKKKLILAHRWSYEYHVGPIPDGLQLDHLCRNRACVNPDHLEPVTAAENSIRRPLDLRRRGGPPRQDECNKGHVLADPNLYVQPKTGKRFCRACRAERAARYGAKRSVA